MLKCATAGGMEPEFFYLLLLLSFVESLQFSLSFFESVVKRIFINDDSEVVLHPLLQVQDTLRLDPNILRVLQCLLKPNSLLQARRVSQVARVRVHITLMR